MGTTLLEPQPIAPPNPWLKRILVGLVVVLVAGTILYFLFRYYPEKRHVARFMDALVAEDYRTAYALWKPQPSFTYEHFMRIWGPNGDYGRIRSYEIVDVKSMDALLLRVPVEAGGKERTVAVEGGGSGVIISIRINHLDLPIRLWVEKKDKSLSFPPF